MIKQIRIILVFILALSFGKIIAQNDMLIQEKILSFEEYLDYVKQYHPLLKQANLRINEGEATLLKARGGFDPKIEVDYDRKKFKSIEYFDQLNATFKIPTWYGIEFKANFEENTGVFLNPNLTVPEGGLYSAGVTFSLAQGLLINERMAMLKKARFFKEQTKAERNLLVNELLFEASKAYFEWLEASNEQNIYESFLKNARQRFLATKRSVMVGDKAAIDSVEAKITVLNRQLSSEAANLKKRKAALKVSNYLWLDNIPLEIKKDVEPSTPTIIVLRSSLELEGITNNPNLVSHPKLRSLAYKIDGLKVDRFLKKNKLLPKVDLVYNFLSTDYDQLNTFNTANYKAMLNLSFPLFLRKERGDLKLATLKLQDARFEQVSTTLAIQNKIQAVNTEISSLETQNDLVSIVVRDYETLVKAEERKFSLGESSLFLINSRERSLINVQLKENSLIVKRLTANASLFNAMGLSLDEAMN